MRSYVIHVIQFSIEFIEEAKSQINLEIQNGKPKMEIQNVLNMKGYQIASNNVALGPSSRPTYFGFLYVSEI